MVFKLLIAVNKNGNIYHVHNDHLNTPRKITSSAGAVMFDWSADDPFGGNTPSVNTIGFNVRYPGQYYDSETGWHYNMNRYYNPKSGKYTQPDPIGLGGGLNMYNYVQGNSLNYYDESGLLQYDPVTNRMIFENIRYAPNFNYNGSNQENLGKIPGIEVNLFTSKGNPIIAYRSLYVPPKGFEWVNYNYDCHGVTFANSEYWIDNDQVPIILKDDYYELNNASELQEQDAIIYYQNGQIKHSLTFYRGMAYGKGGYEEKSRLQPIIDGWFPFRNIPVTIRYFRKNN